jgi:hypothetical protein
MRFLFIALCIFSLPFYSEAQILTNEFVDTSLSLDIVPVLPSPEETVTVSLNDYSGLYFGAEVRWYR